MQSLKYLERLDQVKYLSEENYANYRAIVRLMFRESERLHFSLDKNQLLTMLRQEDGYEDYEEDQLGRDLMQLEKWHNVTAVQDPHDVYTIADFKAKRFQYILTPESLIIERMTMDLEALKTRTTSLSINAFRRILTALDTATKLDEMSLPEINEWWQDLEGDFKHLNENHQDYLRQFYDPESQRQMDTAEFVAHKQRLVRYLEDFIQNMQFSAEQIGDKLEGFTTEQVEHILELVHKSQLDAPQVTTEHEAGWEEGLRAQERSLWTALQEWFCGRDSNARQLMDVTNEIIRQVVQRAALLVQMYSMGVSNKAELRQLMGIFAGITDLDEAHRLSAMVFGAQTVRHFTVNADRNTDQTDSPTWEEPPMEYLLKPRSRVYRPRMDRSGFKDRTAEKAEQRKLILQKAKDQEELVKSFIRDGQLDFGNLEQLVPPEVRSVFLEWLALANLSADGSARTQYGQTFTIRYKSKGTCRMQCTDGVLTMPDCMLVFEGGV